MATATLTPIPGERVDDPPAVGLWVPPELVALMRGPVVSVHRRVCDCPTENVELFGHRQACAAYSVG